MENPTIRACVISADPDLRALVKGALGAVETPIVMAAEVPERLRDIGAPQLDVVRAAQPGLVFLDLADEPSLGVRLAQFLVERDPARRIVALGPALSPELLLEAMRAGVTEYLPKPVQPEAVHDALRRVERKLGVRGDAGSFAGELTAVFGAKGGSGSTTLATNLAVQLHRVSGKKTLLVDLNLELGEIAAFLGMQPRFNFIDLVTNFHRMDAELLASYIEKHESGVHLLSAPFHPERAEAVPGDTIRRILRFLKQNYEYVVVDTGQSFSPATLGSFEEADRILLLTTVDLPSLRNIKRCMPLLDRITGKSQDRVRLVVNRYHPEGLITLSEVEKTLGLEVYRTLANDYESVMKSINAGKPLVLEGKSRYAEDIRAMAADITGIGNVSSNGHKRRVPWKLIFAGRKEAAHE